MIAKINENDLLEYKGMAKMSKDFDEYWVHALKEMENTNPQVEIRKVNLNLKG